MFNIPSVARNCSIVPQRDVKSFLHFQCIPKISNIDNWNTPIFFFFFFFFFCKKSFLQFQKKKKKYWSISVINVGNFNKALANEVVSFEQPVSDLYFNTCTISIKVCLEHLLILRELNWFGYMLIPTYLPVTASDKKG